jgi:probable HAF family extracellular repeat protein
MHSSRLRRTLAATATALAVLIPAAQPASAAAPRAYQATDLGTLGGATSAAAAMNETGQVVGSSVTAAGTTHAFSWRAGRMTDLGTLPGGTYSAAVAVNERGVVAGNATDAAGVMRAVIWRHGRITDLGTLADGATSRAVALDDRNRVLGESEAADGHTHRFRWQNGVMSDLGPVADYTETVGMNNRGDVIGTFHATPWGFPCDCHAGRWRDGAWTDLGTLGNDEAWMGSYPYDINERGEIVGWAWTPQEQHAFRWRDGVMTDLGTLGGAQSRAVAVNDFGAVVGYADGPDAADQPVLWRAGTPTDLSTRGLTSADVITDIDNRARLVGTRAGHATLFR